MLEIKLDKEITELCSLIDSKIHVISDIVEVIAKEKMDFWSDLKAQHKNLDFNGAYIHFPTRFLRLPAEKNNKPVSPKGREVKEGVPPPKPK